jgi:regulation of enolase protein 1 (concanavalin A-like superfamily)/ABC-type transport system involved in multi-copper enzyme maturation permease subunit
MTGRDGFGQLLRAEWTKFRSVRRWVLGLVAAVGLTLGLSMLTVAGSGSDLNDHPEELGPVGPDGVMVRDERNFVHQPLTGDGSITARVAVLTSHEGFTHEWARAGIMVRESAEPGSRYAAIMVTPGHGVRLQANYATEISGSEHTAPRWLRLTRTGDTVTGYESADGSVWSELGTVDLGTVPPTVQVGMFATSPGRVEVESSVMGSSTGVRPTRITGTLDSVRVEPAPASTSWQGHDTSVGFVEGPVGEEGTGNFTESGGVFTVTGSGDLGPYEPDDDVTQLSLLGVHFGQIAIIAVGVLFVTSEFRRGMIRTTFVVSPRRVRVLVAKAVVLGAASFAAGLVATLTAFLLAQPVLRANGFGPPAYPIPSLADWPVLRAVVGGAAFLALVAVLSLGVGAIVRRSAGAITAVVLVLVPSALLVGGLPLSAAQWVMRTTPAAGLSVLQSIKVDHDTTVEPWSMAPPLVGLGVLAAYALAAMAVATWLIRRRDA